MIFPPETTNFDGIVEEWRRTAAQIGIQTGFYVEVKVEYTSNNPAHPLYPFSQSLTRVCFLYSGHEFETLPELNKAIANKAFL
jgi:hypothetical protein